MILVESLLRSADNAGARFFKCIKVPGGFKRRSAKLGNIITLSVNNLRKQKKIDKKKIYYGIIVATKKKSLRNDGSYIKFDRNRVLSLNQKHEFLGTRVYGPICREMRTKKNEVKFKSIISYSGATI